MNLSYRCILLFIIFDVLSSGEAGIIEVTPNKELLKTRNPSVQPTEDNELSEGEPKKGISSADHVLSSVHNKQVVVDPDFFADHAQALSVKTDKDNRNQRSKGGIRNFKGKDIAQQSGNGTQKSGGNAQKPQSGTLRSGSDGEPSGSDGSKSAVPLSGAEVALSGSDAVESGGESDKQENIKPIIDEITPLGSDSQKSGNEGIVSGGDGQVSGGDGQVSAGEGSVSAGERPGSGSDRPGSGSDKPQSGSDSQKSGNDRIHLKGKEKQSSKETEELELSDSDAIKTSIEKEEKEMIQSSPYFKWQRATVPYFLDENSYDEIIFTRIKKAMNAIESVSCVKFYELKGIPFGGFHYSYLHITNPDKIRECVHELKPGVLSEIMMILGFDCLGSRDILHSLMHALYFEDEVRHPQRDHYVRVLWENIQTKYRSLYDIHEGGAFKTMVEYDTQSIMHFHDRAFSVNGGATITAVVPGLVIRPLDRLSQLDIMKLKLIYGQECNKRNVDTLLETCKKTLVGNDVATDHETGSGGKGDETGSGSGGGSGSGSGGGSGDETGDDEGKDEKTDKGEKTDKDKDSKENSKENSKDKEDGDDSKGGEKTDENGGSGDASGSGGGSKGEGSKGKNKESGNDNSVLIGEGSSEEKVGKQRLVFRPVPM
ncbi:uncharacterized protein LOC142981375 [Anticarsia gemmatalis]|uniref:uncharacterized protein LOC142981375 n=1 Tax=Anticarsia gemmatalis TaxID=129554 RepID=UPI003F76506D